MLAAFSRAVLVTFFGSITPALTKSSKVFVAALYPKFVLSEASTFSIISLESKSAFSTICVIGLLHASITTFTAGKISSEKEPRSTRLDALSRAVPPPGT